MRRPLVAALALAGALTPVVGAPAAADPGTLRVASFNSSLNRPAPGGLLRDLSAPGNPQAAAVAEIIQRVRPDLLLLLEFDYDAAGASLAAFEANYLGRSQNGHEPIHFAYSWFGESNTGIPSGLDLDNDGRVAGGADALGFGEFPGQYAMVLLSRFPIDTRRIRTFRGFLWRDMPGALLPDDPRTPQLRDWYSHEELAVLPLSSKSHWDVPVRIGKRTLHLLISHPTPPTFDGAEDRNGMRNHDEIRFWRDYLTRGESGYIHDDRGGRGGFRGGDFLVMGDLNSDPEDGESIKDGIRGLLALPVVNAAVTPVSDGAVEASRMQGGVNLSQRGDPGTDTADFGDRVAGNLRADYLLPSRTLDVCAAGVFWPMSDDAAASLVWGHPPPSSDHRLVWLDIIAGAGRCPRGSDPKASDPSRPGR
jgi:hypothetical protein